MKNLFFPILFLKQILNANSKIIGLVQTDELHKASPVAGLRVHQEINLIIELKLDTDMLTQSYEKSLIFIKRNWSR